MLKDSNMIVTKKLTELISEFGIGTECKSMKYTHTHTHTHTHRVNKQLGKENFKIPFTITSKKKQKY